MTKRFALKLSVAAVAMAFAANASAVDFEDATVAGSVYAAEQNFTAATLDLASGTQAPLEAVGIVGASLGNDAKVFLRFDLPSGVTFDGSPSVDVEDSNSVTQGGTVSLGGDGESFVVFEVSPGVGAQFAQGGAVEFAAAGLTVANKDNVSLRMRTFDQLAFAASEEFALRDRTASNFVSFANAISIDSDLDALSHIADVGASTGAYTDFTTIGTKAIVALKADFTARALIDGTTASLSDIIDDANAVSVTGDFSWAEETTGVFLASASDCTGSVTATVEFDGSGAELSAIAAASLVTGSELFVCATPSTDTAIPAGTYSGTVSPSAEDGFTVASGSTGNGEITRNGTVLRAPFMNNFTGGGQFSFVQIQNNSESAAPFTATCYTFSGSAEGNTLEVPASRTRAFSVAQLGCPANTTAADLVFSIPQGRVNAVMVRQNQTTGDSAVDGLVGNQ